MNSWFDIRTLRPTCSGYYRVFTKTGRHYNAMYLHGEDKWDLPDGEEVCVWQFLETGKEILNNVIRR